MSDRTSMIGSGNTKGSSGLEPTQLLMGAVWPEVKQCKDNFAKAEFHMAVESFESEPESELAYWKCRVANLGIVVCELLVKNERLRRELQMSIYPRSGQASAPMDSQKG
jgi:hypothetical protein